MRICVCKLRLHFPDSKHLRGFVCRNEILGNFFRHSEIFGLHPPPPIPPPTINASYGPDGPFGSFAPPLNNP